MSLINPYLLFGLALTALPVLLHFLMRAKPKKLLFPALRLLQSRRITNARRMRLKHVLLMLMRVAVIGLLVMALARPTLPAANYAPNLREWLTGIGIVAACGGVYWWLTRRWKNQRLSVVELAGRTDNLRIGSLIGAIVLLLLLVAWPYQRRIAAEITGPLPDITANMPVAAVFLFDTSASMEYRLEGESRLQAVQAIALTHLENLPTGSRVAVASTSGNQPIVFQADLASARSRVSGLEIAPGDSTINDRLLEALKTQERDSENVSADRVARGSTDTGDAFMREVYVLSDMAASAWDRSGARRLQSRVEELPWLHTYFIDASVNAPINAAVRELRLSSESVSAGSDLTIRATVSSQGRETPQDQVELLIQSDDGQFIKQDFETVKFQGDSESVVELTARGITGPIRHGKVSLVSADPLIADDARFFTVSVQAPTRVLVLGEVIEECEYLLFALEALQESVRYEPDFETIDSADTLDLSQYQVICLVNPRAPDEDEWRTIGDFVRVGGGLAVFAGRDDLDPISWNSLAAQQFLPARVLGPIRFFDGDASLELDSQSHPLFEEFRSETDGTSMLADIDFWRCWSVEPNEDATVLASFSNTTRKAAIVERPVREGRVIMVTTAIDFLREGGQEWNTLADSWSFLMLVNNTMRQLDWQLSRTSNFISGQAVTIRLTEAEQFESFFLRDPELRQTKRQRPAEASTLTIEDAREPGHYEVRSLDETIPFRTGFSVNLPSDESDLTTLTNLELDKLIGEKRYSRARRMDELDRVVADMRMGREVFPLLLMVAIAFFVGEHLLANWFYDLEHEDESTPNRLEPRAA